MCLEKPQKSESSRHLVDKLTNKCVLRIKKFWTRLTLRQLKHNSYHTLRFKRENWVSKTHWKIITIVWKFSVELRVMRFRSLQKPILIQHLTNRKHAVQSIMHRVDPKVVRAILGTQHSPFVTSWNPRDPSHKRSSLGREVSLQCSSS